VRFGYGPTVMRRLPFPRRGVRSLAVLGLLVALGNSSLLAWPGSKMKEKFKKAPQDDALETYLKRARQWYSAYTPTTGSLWNPQGMLVDFASDAKARHLGDAIKVQLVEQTSSSAQGSVQTARTMTASSGISAFFGALSAKNSAQNLFTPNSSQTLNGKGQTALATTLTTTLAGNVVEVLPNELMVIEARREVNVSDQKQTLVLRGIVRGADVSPANVVLSSAMSQLEVKLVGKGVITEGTHPPNIVVRWMLRILGF